jgi:hypothetical protein
MWSNHEGDLVQCWVLKVLSVMAGGKYQSQKSSRLVGGCFPLAALGAGPLAALGAGPIAVLGAGPLAILGAGPLAVLGANPLAALVIGTRTDRSLVMTDNLPEITSFA